MRKVNLFIIIASHLKSDIMIGPENMRVWLWQTNAARSGVYEVRPTAWNYTVRRKVLYQLIRREVWYSSSRRMERNRCLDKKEGSRHSQEKTVDVSSQEKDNHLAEERRGQVSSSISENTITSVTMCARLRAQQLLFGCG
jgi:hypothetical protein